MLVYGRRLGDALLPSRCGLCNEATQGAMLCAACTVDLPWNTPACPACAHPSALGLPCPACQQKPRAFDAAFVAFTLQSPVQQAIHALKYRAQFREATLLGKAFADALRARAKPLPELLLPVPLHWRRQWQRGYNQSLELARVIGSALAMPVATNMTRRVRATTDQLKLSAVQRRQNLKGAFMVSAAVAGRRIALLDDVMTTGATLEELARAAKAAGAVQVEAWAIARQPLGAR